MRLSRWQKPRNRFRHNLSARTLSLETRIAPAILIVNSIADSGPGTLRDAIDTANLNAQADTITFDLGPFPASIALTTELPAITEAGLLIDGWSHAAFAGSPVVEINGSFTFGAGLRINASNVTVRGLAINGWSSDGVQVFGPISDVTLHGNFVGTDLSGSSPIPNLSSGIALFDTLGTPTNVKIGGSGTNQRNLISGNNGNGIYVGGAGTSSITIAGNFIGTNIAGNAKLSNGNRGVYIDNNVKAVTVGGATAGDFNLIGGNNNAGVYVDGVGSSGHTIQGNIIGTDVGMTLDLGNAFRGIWFNNGTKGNVIRGNLIAASKSDGIILENGAAGNTIAGNTIALNEAAGIAIINSPTNTVGGPNLADRNYIGGNRDGLFVVDNSYNTVIQNNYIGIDQTATQKLGNTNQGIEIGNAANVKVLDNVIVGNKSQGIEVRDGSDFVVIQGNRIGIDQNGNVFANGDGILVRNESEGAQIGGSLLSQRNIVSGNTGRGIAIQDVNSPAFQLVQWKVADGGNDHYYVLTPSSLWTNAQTAAAGAGGYLASIGDVNENTFLTNNFSAPVGGSVLIGYTDDPAYGGTEFGNTSNTPDAGKGWVWVDGKTPGDVLGYNNWGVGEPNNFGAGENYAELRTDGFWNDNGLRSGRAIIEFESLPDLNKLGQSFNLTTRVENNYIGVDITGAKTVPNGGNGININNYNGGLVGGLDVTDNVVSGNTGHGVRVTNVGGQVGLFQWTEGPGANNHYYIVGPSTTFVNAEKAAQQFGGNLASIGNADEQAFLQSKVLPFAGGATVWIGYTDDVTFGGEEFGNTSGLPSKGRGYVWTDGTPVTYDPFLDQVTSYQNWNGGEPNDAGATGEDYAELTTGGGWNDLNRLASRRTLFEFKTLPDIQGLIAAVGLTTNISDNLIGTDATGKVALGNGIHGVSTDNSSALTIEGNTIAASTKTGIDIVRGGFNRVQGNFIGTDATGTIDFGNKANGVTIAEGTGNIIGSNFDGKNDAAEANVIRFNDGNGVSVEVSKLPSVQWTTGPGANNNFYVFVSVAAKWADAEANAVKAGGNLVSIGSAEEQAFVNTFLKSQTGGSAWIGYTDDEAFGGTEFGNTSGASNKGQGWVWTDGTPVTFDPFDNKVTSYQNWNGGEPNDAGGEDYAEMVNGGGWNDLPTGSTRQSIFEFKGTPDFVTLSQLYPQQPTIFNSVRGNSISGNGLLGIDLGGNGVTPNDVGDPDVGPNTLINFPTVTAVTPGGTTTVSGTYNGLANQKFNLDFYASASGSQGERYLGTTQVTTDGSGNATYSGVVLANSTVNGEVVTVTATDLSGNSSEFSAAFKIGAPAAAAKITSVKIDDGTTQRSLVRSLTVTFDQPIDTPLNPAAFSLTRQGGGAVNLAAAINGSNTVVTLTFTGGEVDFTSLKDGRYDFKIDATKITTGGGTIQLDGDGNGTPGGDYVLNSATSPSPPTNIWRLFGDQDGDNDVDATDFNAFRLAFGGAGSLFDFDGDNDTDASDFNAFRTRFGTSI